MSRRVCPNGPAGRAFSVLLPVLLAGLALPAMAINKCTGADGRVTYTDGPCARDSRVSRIETPPPTSREEEFEARARADRLVGDARVLEDRQAAESRERQRRYEAERAAEAAQQRQRDEAERQAAIYPAPFVPRYRPPLVPVPPKPKPEPQERPALMRSYPFR